MSLSSVSRSVSTIELSGSELSGALGDSITVLPIVVSLAVLTPISLPHVLLLFGAFQVVWGVYYGLPISVEPMKALSALAIAGSISYAELAVAGLLAGVVLLVLGRTHSLSRVERFVGTPVVRGVQLAVSLLLLKLGLGLAVSNLRVAALGVALVVVAMAVSYRSASSLVVLGAGVAIAVATAGVPTLHVPGVPTLPTVGLGVTDQMVEGTLAQLAMTVGNAAVATSLLFSDLFDADVSVDELSTSMGVMNLCSVPLGGIPMCHGSGGLAGKYAFGARTAGANVILGVLYALAALVAGAGLLAAFPMAILGVLLVLVSIQLGRSGLQSDRLALSAGIGVLGLVTNVGVAFLVGVAALQLLERVDLSR